MTEDYIRSEEPNYFSSECSNPVAWHRQHDIKADMTFKTALYSVVDMKHTVWTEQYSESKPEFVWNLFLYNTYISFNHIMHNHLDEALEIINQTEKILSKLTEHSTDFLNSIKQALYHITLSTKGYILTKRHINTKDFGTFVPLRDMDVANEAALYAVQSAFSSRYNNRWCILSKMCLLRAIALNPVEPEWHYMLSYCLTNYRKRLYMTNVLPQELTEAEIAVSLSNKAHYKCHLAKLLHNVNYSGSYTQDTLKAIQMIKDIINDSDDVFILRRCLKILTKMLTTNNVDIQIVSLAETIISKIMSSNNSFVRDSIGHYYMYYEKNLEKAKIYLKMASDGKCFGASIDYVYVLFVHDPSNTPVVEILESYLDVYPFLTSHQIILSLIVSFLLLNKNDIVGALKYIDKLLDIRVPAYVHRMQTHRTKFCNTTQKLNLSSIIFDELKKNLDNITLSAENVLLVKQMFEKINEFNLYVDSITVKTEKKFFDLDSKINILTQNQIAEGKCCMTTKSSCNSNVKKNAENWRTLKPNDGPNVFTLNKHRHQTRQNNV